LSQAFENLGIQQVNFAADSINTKSIRALMALGAVQGKTIVRHIQRPDGSWRDTIKFYISEQAWPLIKRQIEAKIR
jgi:RimJ/RimL family protein N-acetyltransferase